MTAKSFRPMIGQTLGHYRILERVGAGGMGVVYRARNEELERDVAVKVLPMRAPSNDSARRHFRKEALVLAKLNHPNIATIYEFGSQECTDFLAIFLLKCTSTIKPVSVVTKPADYRLVTRGTRLAFHGFAVLCL